MPSLGREAKARSLLHRKRTGARAGATSQGLFLGHPLAPRKHESCLRNPVRCSRPALLVLSTRYPAHRLACRGEGAHDLPPSLLRPRSSHARLDSCLPALAIPTRSSDVLLKWAHSTNGAMQFHELLGRHLLSSFENLASSVVRSANLSFFLVGQGHDSK